jgi:hypothetical protein
VATSRTARSRPGVILGTLPGVIRFVADIDWPPRAVTTRVLDLDGTRGFIRRSRTRSRAGAARVAPALQQAEAELPFPPGPRFKHPRGAEQFRLVRSRLLPRVMMIVFNVLLDWP